MSTTTPFMRRISALISSSRCIAYAERFVPGEGEDVCQTVGLNAHRWEQRGHAPPTNIEAWVLASIRNECLTVIAATKAKRVTPRVDPVAAYESPAAFPLGCHGDDADLSLAGCGDRDVESEAAQAIDDERSAAALRAALERIPALQRAAIVNTYAHGIQVRDSKRQGAPFGTVVSRISRGKAALRAELAEVG
jgi:DNA-directed RNA polymerase specialized sigma24 family protein